MDFDIRAAADEVNELFLSNRGAEAVRLLDAIREGQPVVIREALDRYVAATALNYFESVDEDLMRVGVTSVLDRLAFATLPPRIPGVAEMDALSSSDQRHDVYASIFVVRGSPVAAESLERGDRVVLGLRQETSTLAASGRAEPWRVVEDRVQTQNENESKRGTGVYDDRLIVLWKSADGARNVHVAEWANTEPSAQYDAHAGGRVRRHSPHLSSVAFRRGEGQDVDGDHIRDLGRLAEGTVEMQRAVHPTPDRRGDTHVALRPSNEAVRSGVGGVERDSNADGWFTNADIQGRQNLNNTFKIHQGSAGNSDSAGCQTIHPNQYASFIGAVTANPRQTRWQYVLTSTTPSDGRELELGGARVGEGVPRLGRVGPAGAPHAPLPHPYDPQRPVRHLDGRGMERELRHELRDEVPAPAPTHGPPRPDDPRHPDHALLLQIRGIVRARDGHEAPDESRDERMSRALLVLSKEQGMTSVDHLMAHGGRLFIVQGQLHDPAHRRGSIDAGAAMRSGLEQSDRQLEEINSRLGAELGSQQREAHQGQVQASQVQSLRV